MGRKRQTRYSCNDSWSSRVLFHVPTSDGLEPNVAVLLVLNNPIEVNLQAGTPIWFKWVVPRDYTGYDFLFYGQDLSDYANDLSYYTIYESDLVTLFDMTGDNMSSSSEWFFFSGSSTQFQNGSTYYMSFMPPVSGTLTVNMLED